MPKTVHVSDADLNWLKKNHTTHSYPDMARRIGCCVDTLKRILVREGLQEFEGAKYQVAQRNHKQAMWERPCMGCGEPEHRPRFWYFCRSCRKNLGYTE